MNQIIFVLRLQQPTAHPQIRSTSSSVLVFHLIIQLFFSPKSRKCQKVLGKNMELWENEVYRFKTIGQLKVGVALGVTGSTCHSGSYRYWSGALWFQAISQYLPRGDLRLRPAIYEMILHEFLKTDYEVPCLRRSPVLNHRLGHELNCLSHFLSCPPQRVSPHWSVNGPEIFIITWRLSRQWRTTWRRTPVTELCSPRWLNCEWCQFLMLQHNKSCTLEWNLVSFISHRIFFNLRELLRFFL